MGTRCLTRIAIGSVLVVSAAACGGKDSASGDTQTGGSSAGNSSGDTQAGGSSGDNSASGGSVAGGSSSSASSAGSTATSTIAVDSTTMTRGETNKTGFGGYWWTWVDRSGRSSIVPNTGKVEPKNPFSTNLNAGIAKANGIEDDGTGNLAFHVTGTVAPEPVWTTTLGTAIQADGADWRDLYWDTSYASLCQNGLCAEVTYPAAALGMGFKSKNVPLGSDATDKVGMVFRFKLGATHPGGNAVTLVMPMDLTDVPDSSLADEFGTIYGEGSLHSGAAAPLDVNAPFCSFPNSLNADGESVGVSYKTCLAHLSATIPSPTTAWETYCVSFGAFRPPTWASAGLTAAGITTPLGLESRIIKFEFNAYQPGYTAVVPAPFDFWVDDVLLVDEGTWTEQCASATLIE